MPDLVIALIIIGAIVLLLAVFLISSYNRFVTIRNRVKDQASQIDVQLKRRFELIPNLIETVKGVASFERETIEAVTKARAEAMKSQTLQESTAADQKMTGALHRLLAVSESYPELKASANFAQLQQELSSTEDKIAMSRQFYNDTVLKYNNTIEVFPANIAAGITGFKHIDFLQIAEAERESVKVAF
jgi:LemA protein